MGGVKGIVNNITLLSFDVSNDKEVLPENISTAIDICIQKNVDIIYIRQCCNYQNDILYDGIKKAFDKGIIIVSPLINGNLEETYPALYDEVIGVSSYTGNFIKKYNVKKDGIIFIKSDNILSTYSSFNNDRKYSSLSDDSIASAIIYGIICNIKQAGESLNMHNIKELLTNKKYFDIQKIVGDVKSNKALK